jgi:hypothetical protein
VQGANVGRSGLPRACNHRQVCYGPQRGALYCEGVVHFTVKALYCEGVVHFTVGLWIGHFAPDACGFCGEHKSLAASTGAAERAAVSQMVQEPML